MIDLTGAHLADRNGLVLDLADAVVGGSIYLIGRQVSRSPGQTPKTSRR